MADNKQAVIVVPWMALFAFVLAVLKLTGKIAVSWWVVFAPIWIPLAFVLPLIGVILIATFIAALVVSK